MSAGYSGTPLAKKLGYAGPVWSVGMPDTVREEIESAVEIRWTDNWAGATAAHFFVTQRAALEKLVATARKKLADDAMVWISWPKKSAKIATEITEDVIRDVALPTGFVDIKVCAVDATWSGLKLMVRKELRTSVEQPA